MYSKEVVKLSKLFIKILDQISDDVLIVSYNENIIYIYQNLNSMLRSDPGEQWLIWVCRSKAKGK